MPPENNLWTLYTWNVNGLRSCGPKSFSAWLDKERPHIVALQETKLTWDVCWDFPLDDYHTWYSCADKLGYSGVAIYSRTDIPEPIVCEGLGVPEFDSEGRTLIAEYPDFFFFSCYFPNGGPTQDRVPFKLDYSKCVAAKALELKQKTGKEVIIAGDYNVAHKEIDLKNPKGNQKTSGFTPAERAWMDEFLSKGFVDNYREQHPGEEGRYTWWHYRPWCRPNNIGWRIDYLCTTPGLRDRVESTFHRPDVLGSDHCPTGMNIRV